MEKKQPTHSVRPLVTLSLVVLFLVFLIQALSPLYWFNWHFMQGVKAITVVLCVSVLVFWQFLRNTKAESYRNNAFRLKRTAVLLLLQVFVGLTYFFSEQHTWWQSASAVGLLISGLIYVSLHRVFLYKRIADSIVVFAVTCIFLTLIAFVSAINCDFYAWQEVNPVIYVSSLLGAVLLLTTALLRAQYKLNGYTLFEFIPVLIAITGFFEVFAVAGNTMWWSAVFFQFCILYCLYRVLNQLNTHSSADWQMFKDGFDLSHHAYFCSDNSGQVRFVNQAYMKLLEVPEGTPLRALSHPLYTHPLADTVNKSLSENKHWKGETVLITTSGKVISVLAEFSITSLGGKRYQQAWFYDIHEKIELKQNESVILEKLERLSFSLMERQEEERRYFAKELHDEIGQGLTLLKLQQQLPEPDKDLITTVLSELIDKVRNLSLNLRPAILDDMGLSSALDWLSDRQRRFSQLAVTTEIDKKIPRLADKVEISVFRIAQEAFTNIHKYSHADHVLISCQMEGDYLQLVLEDNGVGFDVDAKLNRANKGQSLGLLSIKERAFLVNGLVNIHSTPEQGTRIELRVPMQIENKGEVQ